MDFFDLKTAYVLMGLHYFTMPATVWLALRHKRRRPLSIARVKHRIMPI